QSPLPLTPNGPQQAQQTPAQDQPAFAIRYGKLPPGLPKWFVEFDTDHDGQIGFHEWRAEGRSAEEFAEMDRNGDFLITPEELLRFIAERARQRPNPDDQE